MARTTEPRSGSRVAAAAAVIAIVAAVLIASRGGDGARSAPAERDPARAAPPADPLRLAPPAPPRAEAPPPPGDGHPFWRPGAEHWYGDDADPFIRQPLDYPTDTPAILGNRISYHLYDLETVQDMVRRGREPDSEIARVLGRPLSDAEWQAGRRVLQAFFDDMVPRVDALIAGDQTLDEGYAFIGPRRRRLDAELREALHLDDDRFYKLWPQVRERDDNLDQLREP
jgi:hypothetical protein